jgi:hypothetical protein
VLEMSEYYNVQNVHNALLKLPVDSSSFFTILELLFDLSNVLFRAFRNFQKLVIFIMSDSVPSHFLLIINGLVS